MRGDDEATLLILGMATVSIYSSVNQMMSQQLFSAADSYITVSLLLSDYGHFVQHVASLKAI